MRDPELLADEQRAPLEPVETYHFDERRFEHYRSSRQRINAAALVLGVCVFSGMLAVWAFSCVEEKRAPSIQRERGVDTWRSP